MSFCIFTRRSFVVLKLALALSMLTNLSNLRGQGIVDVEIVELSGNTITDIPVTFGQVFAPGDVPDGALLAARTLAGLGIPLQVDAKARHADGSLRHAILSMIIPALQAGSTESIGLILSSENPAPGGITPDQLLTTAYDVNVTLNVAGTIYAASAREILQSSVSIDAVDTWLSGTLVAEWLVMSPLKDGNGNLHPHLTARFDIRAYAGLDRIRTDIILENNWTYVPEPSGFEYDVTISVGGTDVYSKSGLMHTHHARWHKVIWSGQEPNVYIRHNADYLIKTGAVPNYDQSVNISQSAISGMQTSFEPMSNGNLTSYMPTTGAQPGIGPLPRWAALYLLSMDARAKANTLANGGAGGSYQIHYRDKKTGLPVSLDDFPRMTILGNPIDSKSDAFPEVTNGLGQYTPDDAHQPSIAYLPYLVTGDYFYLEELHFWANYNMLMANPNYRGFEKGLLKWGQVRSQAWSLRTLGHAAYITPDTHPMKAYYVERLGHNLDWYNSTYSSNPDANKLGILERGVRTPRPWMDDFFTWAVGHLVELGFAEAELLLEYKATFPIGRMTPPYCWLYASLYSGTFADSAGNIFANFADYYNANFYDQECSGYEMIGRPWNPTGYGANLQPALAMALDAGVPNAREAWATYETRDPKQDYSESPQFAVVPRILDALPTAVEEEANQQAPEQFRLIGNYPNPFNPITNIVFELPQPGAVSIILYDIKGKTVAQVLLNVKKEAGRHTIPFNASNLASGVYFYRISLDKAKSQHGKFLLLK